MRCKLPVRPEALDADAFYQYRVSASLFDSWPTSEEATYADFDATSYTT